MCNKRKLLIIGGDLRQIYCGRRLAKQYDVYIMGFDDELLPVSDIKKANCTMKSFFDYIVLPVPALQSGEIISTPFSKEKFTLSDIKKLSKPNGVIFGGKLDEKVLSYLKGNPIADYMEREELNILNAVPTAEGAVQIAMEELPATINSQKVLVAGYGRIGKALVNILKGLGADITVSVHSSESESWAKLAGLKTCSTKNIEGDYGLIFNTVPKLIFTKDVFDKLNPDVLIIDLASKPGGVDFDTATQLGIKVVWALGLPGKIAPITSGEIIADTISGIIQERSEADVKA